MFIADFHIHSKYSRATSKDCVPKVLDLWARRKGLGLIGTGDFTHPAWRQELQEKLTPAEDGLYMLKRELRQPGDVAGPGLEPRFILSAEISSIYKKNGRVRKVHNLILLPSLEAAEALSHRLEAIGNLHSDGRPILGLDSRDLLEISLGVCPEVLFIPAHIWTPHFSLFGAYSGFDTIEECFEDLTGHIHALETGLSSDPPMNWRLSALDRFVLVSNSDAHSPANLAREANVFDTELSYGHVAQALSAPGSGAFRGTLEFFPEEGKYHCDGHRACKVCQKPAETLATGGVCPVCGGRITVGVLHRVEALADRPEGHVPSAARQYESLVPLQEAIAASMGMTTASARVREKYDDMLRRLGPELFILREAAAEDIQREAGPLIAEGIRRLRLGKVGIQPGYDGEYGKISILDKAEITRLSGQVSFLGEAQGAGSAAPKGTRKRKESGPPASTAADRQRGAPEAAEAEALPYGLNREQWEAVCAQEPAVAVIAGPGTGKTKTLVSRIAHLVQQGVPGEHITAVTFTNKAAAEMRARLDQQFGDSHIVQEMSIGTFHSICLKLLAGPEGKTAVTIIDEPEALSLIKEILGDLGLKDAPRDVLRGISLIKNGAAAPEESADVPSGVYDLYRQRLAQYGVVDYDDILLNVLTRLDGEPDGVPAAFTHLLVDEFQDINAIQYLLIRRWSAGSAGLFVIGDPDQSIYGFRGSNAHCFARFFEDYPQARRVALAHNYRSTPQIVGCAKPVVQAQHEGQAFPLEARRDSGAMVRLLEAGDAFSEAVFVAKEINRMVGGIDMLAAQASPASKERQTPQGNMRGFSDIAVLYRTNRQAEALEQCLATEGIPYAVAGREETLNDLQVRRALAFFRLLLNPADPVSLRICLREAGVPKDAMQGVMQRWSDAEKSIPALCRVLNGLELPARTDAPQGLAGMLTKYEPLATTEKPDKLLELWLKENAPLENDPVQRLLHTAVLHDDMPSLLHNLALGRESDVVRSGARRHTPDAVKLMTLHGSKGLEFPVVFLCGVNEGMIPLQNYAGACDPEEERRLFYVGMTRAQDELVLLTSPTPSPFLADLPEELLARGNTYARRQEPAFEQFSFI